MDGVREKGTVLTPSVTIHYQVPAPTLVDNTILGVLILKDWQVDLHMASWFLAGISAMAWMPQSFQLLRYWWDWWWRWCCAPITLKSMIWQKQRWLGWSLPQLLLSLALVPASLWCLALFLLSCLRPKPGHPPSFSDSQEVGWSWGQILVLEIEWHHHRWNRSRASRPPWFDVLFSDGLGN